MHVQVDNLNLMAFLPTEGGQSEQFKGRVSHFQNELKHGNASIVIRDTNVIDSGSYICVFPRLQPDQTFHIELVVVGCDPCLKLENKHGKTAGAAPEPRTSIVDITELGVLLKCDVRGAFPQPKVEWQDSDGNILPAEDPQVSERGGRYDVSIQTTVNKPSNNRFHCVATQQLIGHRVKANITVSEKLFEETFSKAEMNARFSGGIIWGVVLTLLQFLLLL
ncbi:butyrophilin subfamily 3 member A2-like [Trematomus bernacchii]|uniref:butyrophilin subfamily 3 member A2-like n=1 Tax=Trematomus bernacchii TaxID=40690 RepID=UPI00146DB728|nr:butyrophilin subfamily 3 member A2-like [Trematomus bernacchii]